MSAGKKERQEQRQRQREKERNKKKKYKLKDVLKKLKNQTLDSNQITCALGFLDLEYMILSKYVSHSDLQFIFVEGSNRICLG